MTTGSFGFRRWPTAGRKRLGYVRLLSLTTTFVVLGGAGAAAAATGRTGQLVMGTVLEVTVVAGDEESARSLAGRAIAIAKHWEDVLTTWRPDGELAVLNATAGEGLVEISEDLEAALTSMERLSVQTGGAFDPTVGPLVAHYRAESAPSDKSAPVPPISTALVTSSRRASLQPGAALDAGGIGKGIALDAIATELRSAGATGAFLDFGGSSQLAFGSMEDGQPWRVAVAGLRPGTILGTIALDGALATSRSRPAGDPAGPIVDPRNGSLVDEPRMATCVAASAAVADAWSTALIVLGVSGLERAEASDVPAMVQIGDGEPAKSARFSRLVAPISSSSRWCDEILRGAGAAPRKGSAAGAGAPAGRSMRFGRRSSRESQCSR